MPENILEHTTSIAGLTCKPLSILSQTISTQEMSMARGGNGDPYDTRYRNSGHDPGQIYNDLKDNYGTGCDDSCTLPCCEGDPDPSPQTGFPSTSSTGGDGTIVGSPDLIEGAADVVSDIAEWDPDIPGPSEIVNGMIDGYNELADEIVDFVAENFDIYLTEDAEIEAEIEAMEEEERQREEEERQRLDEEGEENEGENS